MSIIATMMISVSVYSHCHNTAPCEQVQSRVVGSKYWNRVDIPVRWFINPTKPNMPSLTTDVTAMARAWSNIEYNNGTIPFSLGVANVTNDEVFPTTPDNKNIVGWANLGAHTKAPAGETRIRYWQSFREIIEADIGFNYYKFWRPHSNPGVGYFCIKDTAAHEWGHFAGLEHVQYNPNDTSGIGNCPHWVDYTMHTTLGTNTHERESLACEDKWALDYKY